MWSSRIRRSIGAAIAISIVLSFGVSTVESAIPNPTNKRFYACFTKKTGDVRLINYPKVSTCQKGERLVKWNAKGPAGPQGPQGAKGDQGPQGPQGPAGEAGITNITLTKVTAEFKVGGSSERGQATATCPAGKVVGGGFSQVFWDVVIRTSAPEGTSGWRVAATWAGPPELTVTVYAICMTTEPAGVISTAKVKIATKKGK